MSQRQSTAPQEKSRMHPRNKNRAPYNLGALLRIEPRLNSHLHTNRYGGESIDFAHPEAVKLLNKALLHHYYKISYWEFPDDNLCPPIPGRADYLHYIADLLAIDNQNKIPYGSKITGLDIGIGASCIYPILGVTEYQWNFIGSDINGSSIFTAKQIVENNKSLNGKIDCRLQRSGKLFFHGIINPDERIDITVCNPPFHASIQAAKEATMRKVTNLTGKSAPKSVPLNFSGIKKELIYSGGEVAFIQQMIKESTQFSKQVLWFTSLVSRENHVDKVLSALKRANVVEQIVIPMGTGNKVTRIVAWTYHTAAERKNWAKKNW